MTENGPTLRGDDSIEQTRQVMRELRAAFKLDSDSAVVRRAIGLARFLAREAKDDHTIVIERKDGSRLQLLLDA